VYYDMSHDNYAYSGNEGRESDDYTPYPADVEYEDNGAVNYADWYKNASGGDCPWCKDGEMSEFDPSDDDEAVMWLCSGHIAEFMGMSIDGVKRMDSELYQDRQ
jgi:hypothetical protein